jgi:hypothetical protein
MNSRNGTRRQRKVILIFGEDQNDTKSIKELLVAASPGPERVVKPMIRPPVLIRDCSLEEVASRAAKIVDIIDAERATADVIAVLAHEDCDKVEPAHVALSQKIEQAFLQHGYSVYPVTPAWELETWWFLWPEAVASHRSSWRRLDPYKGKQVGLIPNSKERLRRALRPQGGGSYRDYRESDSPAIARKVREMGLIDRPEASSDSFEQFRQIASTIAKIPI